MLNGDHTDPALFQSQIRLHQYVFLAAHLVGSTLKAELLVLVFITIVLYFNFKKNEKKL